MSHPHPKKNQKTKKTSKRILVTRPSGNISRTLPLLESLGHEVCHSPLLSIRLTDEPFPSGDYNGILLSSVHSVSVLREHWTNLDTPIFAVGLTTADEARRCGYTNVVSGSGGAYSMVESATSAFANSPSANFLYPCAVRPSADVCGILRERGFGCSAWHVYESIEATSFTDSARDLLLSGSIDCVLLYSSRTADCFVRLFTALNPDSTPRLLVLSASIASRFPAGLREHCEISSSFDENSLTNMI